MVETPEIRRAFVELWGRMGPFWGVPPTTARVYGWLLSQADPQTADEVVAGLELSRGAVSMAVKELRDWGLVFVERVPGERRSAYRPETDLEKAIRNIVQTRKRREWNPILENLRVWIPELSKSRGTGAKAREAEVFRERLESIAALVGTADRMAESFLAGGLVQRLGLKALVKAAGRPKKRPPQPGKRTGKRT